MSFVFLLKKGCGLVIVTEYWHVVLQRCLMSMNTLKELYLLHILFERGEERKTGQILYERFSVIFKTPRGKHLRKVLIRSTL